MIAVKSGRHLPFRTAISKQKEGHIEKAIPSL